MTAFRDQPIIMKARLMTVALLLAFIAAILITFGTYWYLGSRRSIIDDADARAEAAATEIDGTLRSITEDFVSTFGTDAFALEFSDIMERREDTTRIRVMLQDELMRLASSDPIVLSALIVDADTKEAYTLFRDMIIPSRAQTLWDVELAGLDGVSVLPPRPSPIRGQGTIIPMAFPLDSYAGGVIIAKGKAPLVAVVLLSEEAIRNMMPEESLITDSNGTVITGDSSLFPYIPKKAGSSVDGVIFACREDMPFSGLSLSSVINLNSALLRVIGTASSSLLAALIIIVMITALLSMLLRRYVTSPIGKLKKAVKEIEKGNYAVKASFTGSDELGELRDAISLMARTIEKQIQEIKDEEEKQTKMEMRLLSEQLTPHFLYNTLECIQQEIQNGNTLASSEMTRALSLYLRTVLSYGSETITVKNEIQHDMSYIRIMNGRFRKDITYLHEADPMLEDTPILKMVLQPFIENSIKHGFGIGEGSTWIQQPEISTSFTREGDRIRIVIADNGKGFDESMLLSIMKGEEGSEGHVGIRNTYLRLIKFYGEDNVSVTVSSIPYYRSSIAIEIPWLSK